MFPKMNRKPILDSREKYKESTEKLICNTTDYVFMTFNKVGFANELTYVFSILLTILSHINT